MGSIFLANFDEIGLFFIPQSGHTDNIKHGDSNVLKAGWCQCDQIHKLFTIWRIFFVFVEFLGLLVFVEMFISFGQFFMI